MWCNFCKKEVDFNSVAVSNPKRAYSMDLEGDVTPTVITSSNAQVINVCKSCGQSDYMFINKEAVVAQVKAHEESVKTSKQINRGLVIISLFLGFIAGVLSFVSGVSGVEGGLNVYELIIVLFKSLGSFCLVSFVSFIGLWFLCELNQ